MSALDSEAVFRARLHDFHLAGLVQDFVDKGWTTFGNFAFASAYVPGTGAAEDAFVSDVITPLLGGDPADARKPAVRRLFYEAYTLAAADLRWWL